MQSLEASKALNIQADLIYIDAAHDEENVYQDVIAWYPHLTLDGILCGDDWSLDSVKRGVTQAAITLNRTVHYKEHFWRLK